MNAITFQIITVGPLSFCFVSLEKITTLDFTPVQMAAALSSFDPCSFSEPESCVVKHIHVKLDIDFDNHILKGHARIDLEQKKATCDTVVRVFYRSLTLIAILI